VTYEDLLHGISLISSLGDLHNNLLPIIMGCPLSALVWRLLAEESVVSDAKEKFVIPLGLIAKTPEF